MSHLPLPCVTPSTRYSCRCRNLEWVVCAARGLLPGQTNLIFDPPPAALETSPLFNDAITHRYSWTSIFYLEACMLATLCSNANELFQVARLQPFVCEYVPDALPRLVVSLGLR
jgi:hypothetical protein